MKAKTRTNQPVYYFFESQQDMTKLSGSFLNSLVAGDIVVKQSGEQQHAYIVSYKQDGTGICLTYTDASVVETISYDYVGSNWEYNSTDVTELVDKDNVALLSGANFTGGITAPSIVENMSGYSFTKIDEPVENVVELEHIYAGAVKNGNKLTIVSVFNITRKDTITGAFYTGYFKIPVSVANKLYSSPVGLYNLLSVQSIFVTSDSVSGGNITCHIDKSQTTDLYIRLIGSANMNSVLTLNTKFFARIEATFLLSDNLIPQE